MEYGSLRNLIFDKAIPAGARQIELTSYEWNVGAYCDDPLAVTHHARMDDRFERNEKWRHSPGSLTLHMTGLPCRKCVRCTYVKRRLWRERAERECAFWPRTWFVTFTFTPEVHHAMLMSALAQKNREGWPDADFTEAYEFSRRCEEVGRQLTRYFKRVRKVRQDESPANFRYLWVTEEHASGLPHAHALIHDLSGMLTYRRLTSRWHLGFVHAKLLDDKTKGAKYVTKYITKADHDGRVRASLHYGEPHEILQNARKA